MKVQWQAAQKGRRSKTDRPSKEVKAASFEGRFLCIMGGAGYCGVPEILFNRIYRMSETERADLQATSFAENIDTVYIMSNFENKYLHIR